MSLSLHLESKGSPVRAWFEKRFPATQSIARRANRTLRGDADECPVPCVVDSDASLVGTAVDYLLRASIRTSSVEETIAAVAARALAEKRGVGRMAIEIERKAVADIKALSPDRREVTQHEWTDLCIRCLVLARFEQHYRASFRVPTRGHLSLLRQPANRLEDFVHVSLSTASIRDLERLGQVAREDQSALRNADPLILNPRFQLSAALGGADADVIVGHRLVDWKASATTRVVGRHQLWQLIGYVLADSTDEYEIREVGISALRWRSTVSWPLDELLEDLDVEPQHVPNARHRRAVAER